VLAAKLLSASLLAAAVTAVSVGRFDADFDNEMGSWYVVVDGVMGGRSTGHVARNEPGVLRFSGDLSLENNGGFSQMRSGVDGDRFAGTDGIELEVRGDGRTYTFDVRCADARVRAGGFQRTFDTEDGAWTTLRLPFDEFRLHTYGRRVTNAPALAPAMIESIGVTLADKKEGRFRLDVRSIRAYVEGSDADGGIPLELATISERSGQEWLRSLTASTDTADGDRDTDIRADLATLSARSAQEWLSSLSAGDERDERTPASATAEAMRLTELAISRGVPLFNHGQTAACAAIYEVTIESMVALGAADLDPTVVERLERGLAEARDHRSARDRAWVYRRTLDAAYAELARESRRPRGVAVR
jgi:monofunctional biosynthetic peptidoglycan transglycosylase